MTQPTKWHVRPAKTQISLGIHPFWSESSLFAWRKLGSLATHWANSEDSDRWAHSHFVGFVVRRLYIYNCNIVDWAEKPQIKRTNKLATFNIFASLSRCPKLFSFSHSICIELIYEENKWYVFKISPSDKTLRSYDQKMCTSFKHRANLLAGTNLLPGHWRCIFLKHHYTSR